MHIRSRSEPVAARSCVLRRAMASCHGGRSSGRGGGGDGGGARSTGRGGDGDGGGGGARSGARSGGRSPQWSSQDRGWGWREESWKGNGNDDVANRSGGWDRDASCGKGRWEWEEVRSDEPWGNGWRCNWREGWEEHVACRDAWRDTPPLWEECSDPAHPSGNDRSGGRWRWDHRSQMEWELPDADGSYKSDGAAQRPLAAHSAPAHQSTSTPAKASDGAAQRRLFANTSPPPPPHPPQAIGRPDSLEHASVEVTRAASAAESPGPTTGADVPIFPPAPPPAAAQARIDAGYKAVPVMGFAAALAAPSKAASGGGGS